MDLEKELLSQKIEALDNALQLLQSLRQEAIDEYQKRYDPDA